MNKQNAGKNQAGFTLIELSIVLVIIGLIVGGVLVGQNLIKSAELRATISQIESLNTSVNTFRGKFGGIPGDCNNCFSTFALGSANGDADGLLESTAASNQMRAFDGEISNFFAMLSSAKMISGNYVAGSGAVTLGTHFPQSKHGRGGIIAVSTSGFNYYLIGAQSGTGTFVATGTAGTIMQATLTPEEAYQLDLKTDDTLPLTGTTTAVAFNPGTNTDAMVPATAAAAATTTCVLNTATPNPYYATNTNPACQVMFRAN